MTSVFAMGQGRLSQDRRKQPRKRKAHLLPQPPLSPYICTFRFVPNMRWMLLPPSVCSPEVYRAFECIPYGLTAVYTAVAGFGESPFKKTTFRSNLPFRISNTKFYTLAFEMEFRTIAFKAQAFRWSMKRLIQAWRVRRLRIANTEDLVTCEEPKVPVAIIDWATRTKYVFEASTLVREFRSKLTQSSGLFPNAVLPKNPYTNETLSIAQLHFVLEAFRKAGKTDWVFEMLRRSGYVLSTFRTLTYTSMRLHILQRQFQDPTNEDTIDTVYDFMGFIYDETPGGGECPELWLWLLQEVHEHPRLDPWRRLCYEYKKGEILLYTDAFVMLKAEILKRGAALVKEPTLQLRNLWRMRPRSDSETVSIASGSRY